MSKKQSNVKTLTDTKGKEVCTNKCSNTETRKRDARQKRLLNIKIQNDTLILILNFEKSSVESR